ncbi:MAG: sulfatase-like hydrolase/transferase, partial [Planctomycetes bacterium]|nr:sulfatase-like hydrolase/transferase [Planctomycetota bacterium]
KQPFFCYLPITPPHGLFNIPDSDPAWQIYQDKPWPEAARRYAAMVTMVDRQVGELRELLRELGVAENTLIVFTGDNGGQDYFRDQDHPRGFHGPNVNPKTGVAFRGQKGRVYEGGLRVPAIFHMPEKIAAGRVSDHLSYFPDVFPTLVELGRGLIPTNLDGISMVPELFGETAARKQGQHQYLYWELGQQRAVRMKNWKAVKPGKQQDWELYNLANDTTESNDLAVDQADVLKQLVKYAVQASVPAQIGDWGDRTLHEKDRRAKNSNPNASKQNLLIIQTDEHNFRTLGCYRDTLADEQAFMWGNSAVVETPHIDRIANEGVLCTSFYATSPVCSPSRASLVSGRYPQNTAVTGNDIPLADDVVTFAELLRQQGWKTGYAGKWHLDGTAKPGWAPSRDFGFSDRRFMFNRGHWKQFEISAAGPAVKALNEKGKPSYEVAGADKDSFATDFLADRAIEFIHENAKQPFCYMLSFPDPHGPDTVRAPYDTMFADQSYTAPRTFDVTSDQAPNWAQPQGRFQNMAKYYGMVKCIDDNVGKVLAALEKEGILDQTVVIFTSDHGDLRGEHHRQNKGVPYEASAKVPFVIRAPNLLPKGKLVHQALATVDFLPTILSLMDVKTAGLEQGRDASALLLRPSPNHKWQDVAFLRQAGRTDQGWLAAVTDRYKLVLSPTDSPWLIDLEVDADELLNFFDAETHQTVADDLMQRLVAYAQRFEDPYINSVKLD